RNSRARNRASVRASEFPFMPGVVQRGAGVPLRTKWLESRPHRRLPELALAGVAGCDSDGPDAAIREAAGPSRRRVLWRGVEQPELQPALRASPLPLLLPSGAGTAGEVLSRVRRRSEGRPVG